MDKETVPFLDLQKINQRYSAEFHCQLDGVLDAGFYIRGRQSKLFEEEFARFCDVEGAIGVGNGLDALRIAIEVLKYEGVLSSGDEVLVPANSFIASALAVSQAGLIPRFIDPSLTSMNIEVGSLQLALSPRTKALMPVHLYGKPADMPSLMHFAGDHGLAVIEDCAQAHGASVGGRPVGSFGDFGAFSFYPGKNIGALGDGGALVSNSEERINLARTLSNYGSDEKYVHNFLGCNSRLDELQAAFLRTKLRYYWSTTSKRRQIAARYNSEIINQSIQTPSDDPGHIYHLYVVKTSFRQELIAHLSERGVGTMIHYPIPIHRQKPYLSSSSSLPNAEYLSEAVLSLPCNECMTEEQIQRVIAGCNEFQA